MLDIICHYGVFYPLHAGCSDDRSWIRRDASPAQCSDLRRRYRRSSGAIDLWSTQCWSRDPRGAWAGGRASAAPRPPRSARGPERIRDLREAPAPVIDKRRRPSVGQPKCWRSPASHCPARDESDRSPGASTHTGVRPGVADQGRGTPAVMARRRGRTGSLTMRSCMLLQHIHGNARTESMNPPRPACERRRAHDDRGYEERGAKQSMIRSINQRHTNRSFLRIRSRWLVGDGDGDEADGRALQ